MPSKEYLQALVNLVKPLISARDHYKARATAGGLLKAKNEAEELAGLAQITPASAAALNDEELFDLQEHLFGLTHKRKKAVYRNAHSYVQNELKRRGYEVEFTSPDAGDVHVNAPVTEIVEDEISMPYPNESACRIASPGQFSRFRRNNSTSPNTIIGFKKGGGSALQSFRYPTSSWPVDRARAHCERHGGSFSPATKEHGADE